MTMALLGLAAATSLLVGSAAADIRDTREQQLVIAASGGLEPMANSLPGVALAANTGVDFIELDIVASGDNHLLVFGSTELEPYTDVADRFPGRSEIDGGYSTMQMSLAEIRQLRKTVTRGLETAPPSLGIPTLQEAVDLIGYLPGKRPVGILINIIAPSLHLSHDLDIAGPLVEYLARLGTRLNGMPVMIMCSESDELLRIKKLAAPLLLDLPLIQQILAPRPENQETGETTPLTADQSWMFTVSGTRLLASYASAVSLPASLTRSGNGAAITPVFFENLQSLGISIYLRENSEKKVRPADQAPLEAILSPETAPRFNGMITTDYETALKSREIELRRVNAPILFPINGDGGEKVLFD